MKNVSLIRLPGVEDPVLSITDKAYKGVKGDNTPSAGFIRDLLSKTFIPNDIKNFKKLQSKEQLEGLSKFYRDPSYREIWDNIILPELREIDSRKFNDDWLKKAYINLYSKFKDNVDGDSDKYTRGEFNDFKLPKNQMEGLLRKRSLIDLIKNTKLEQISTNDLQKSLSDSNDSIDLIVDDVLDKDIENRDLVIKKLKREADRQIGVNYRSKYKSVPVVKVTLKGIQNSTGVGPENINQVSFYLPLFNLPTGFNPDVDLKKLDNNLSIIDDRNITDVGKLPTQYGKLVKSLFYAEELGKVDSVEFELVEDIPYDGDQDKNKQIASIGQKVYKSMLASDSNLFKAMKSIGVNTGNIPAFFTYLANGLELPNLRTTAPSGKYDNEPPVLDSSIFLKREYATKIDDINSFISEISKRKIINLSRADIAGFYNKLVDETIEKGSVYLGEDVADAIISENVNTLSRFFEIQGNNTDELSLKSTKANNTEGLRWEHVIPMDVIGKGLNTLIGEYLDQDSVNKEKLSNTDLERLKYLIKEFLERLYTIAWITTEEDRNLTAAGFQSAMPENSTLVRDTIDHLISGNQTAFEKDLNEIFSRYIEVGTDAVNFKPIFGGEDPVFAEGTSITFYDLNVSDFKNVDLSLEESKQPKLTNLLFGYYG